MKNATYLIGFGLFLISFCFFPKNGFSQLHGNYTINPTLPADSTNYQDFESAISDMRYGTRADEGVKNGPGVNWSVAFKVYDTIYHTAALNIDSLSGHVSFASEGGDSSKCMLIRPSSSSSYSNYLLRISNSNILFEGIGFKRTGSHRYAQVISISNSFFIFSNCQIIGSKVSSKNDDANAILMKNTPWLCGWYNCYIKGGSTNLVDSFTSATFIQNCIFDSAFNNSIHSIGGLNNFVLGNTFRGIRQTLADNASIKIEDANSYSFFWWQPGISGNNFVANKSRSAIILNNNFNQGRKALNNSWSLIFSDIYRIFNNKISISNGHGIYVNNCDSLFIYNNNILFTGTDSTNSALRTASILDSITSLYLANNNIYMNGGKVYDFAKRDHVFESINNNLLSSYKQQFKLGGTYYTILDSFRSKTGLDSFSIAVDPNFVSGRDLTSQNMALDGAGTKKYAPWGDFNGKARNILYADIGADELAIPKTDVRVEPLWIEGEICSGYKNLYVLLENMGSDTVTKVEVSLRISLFNYPWLNFNTIKDTSFIWTGNLKFGDSDTLDLGKVYYTAHDTLNYFMTLGKVNGNEDEFPFDNYSVGSQFVVQSPIANAGFDKEICENGDSITIGVKVDSSYVYNWYDSALNEVSTSNQFRVNPGPSTYYIQKVTDTANGCISYDTVTVVVNPNPVITLDTNYTVCFGDSLLVGDSAKLGYSYKWANDSLGLISEKSNFSFKPSRNEQFLFELSNDSTGCKSQANVFVKMYPKLTTEIIGIDTICSGDSAQFTANISDSSYLIWKLYGATPLGRKSDENKNTNILFDESGSALVRLIEQSKEGCLDSLDKYIKVKERPNATFTADSVVCPFASINLMNTSTHSDSLNWSFGDGNSSDDVNPNQYYETPGSYKIVLLANKQGCTDSASQEIVVDEFPVSTFSVSANGNIIKLVADSFIGNEYIWVLSTGDTLFGAKTDYEYLSDDEWLFISITVTNKNGCSSTSKDSIFIKPATVGGKLFNASNVSVYPNPMHNDATLEIDLPKETYLLVKLYDLQGRELKTIFNGTVSEGKNLISVDDLANMFEKGSYVLRLNCNKAYSNSKLIQIR